MLHQSRSETALRAAVAAGFALAQLAAPASVAAPPTKIGKGEGALNLVAWEGYAEDGWVKPFEEQTGCKVNRKYAGSSDEMVALMRQGGGGQYDLVSASGDASLRLIVAKDVQPLNIDLIPGWKDFVPQLKAPPHNTVDGVHYGVSYEWGPNTLLWNTQKVKAPPTSWAAIYDKQHQGLVTVPDNAIQIADAALYLGKKEPSLGIKDPYELTVKQMDAVVALLKEQRPLVKKYWALASDEVQLFTGGDAVIGAAWPYQTITLKANNVPVDDTIPTEGATGWADSWMLSSKSKHPNCAYLWMDWVTTPKVQAEQALSFGETPANMLACKEMDALQAGSCHQYHADAPGSYFDQIKFWKTPRKDCGDGHKDCLDYSVWQQKWTEIKG
jgi:putative spermidine/putrescine transport system substrate-binding protein